MSISAEEIYKRCETMPLRRRHHGWYVAYAPAENPEITVAVFAEHGCHGNTAGAPVVRDIVQAFMEKFHPERIALAKKQRPKSTSKEASTVPESVGEVD